MSAHLGIGKCQPGRTWFGASNTIATDNSAEALLGQEVEIRNKATLTSTSRRNGKSRLLRLVRNNSGCILYPGQGVVWGATRIGEYVYGVQNDNLNGAMIAGIVDDWLPSAGVRPSDYFFIVIEGEVLGLTPMTGAGFGETAGIAVGDVLYCGVTTAASTGATSGAPLTGYTGGRVLKAPPHGTTVFTATQTTDGTLWSSARHSFARALSARTSGQTNTTVLMEIIRKLK